MFDLKATRTDVGLTQQQMADAMGMPLRSYQDIEAGKNPVRPIHIKAASWALVENASKGGGYNALPVEIGEIVVKAARK
ncbi:helix-turn-helix transcriptional regulator [Shinella sp.]|uniref:helix-turn-helix transcriptional regulator n=1 Tax=Shinella sp. TaxID=1870904 RepID=UPI0029B95AE9|nr:helix-turn-helix transcriptional regulator [Shinella sp.]MDX3973278.1 helix-turn-helix transcriptional regulator [Shinella sp.]